MSVQERAAEVLGAHWYTRVTSECLLACQCGHDFSEVGHRDHQAQELADAGLLAESAPVAGGNGAVSGEQSHPRPTTPVTVDSLTARLVAARAATDGYRTEAERLRELLDEAHAKIERMEAL